MRVKGAEVGNRVQTAVGTIVKALQKMTFVNQLSFISGYRKYAALGSLGTNPNLH